MTPKATVLNKYHISSWSPFFSVRDFLVWLLVIIICIFLMYEFLLATFDNYDVIRGAGLGIGSAVLIMRVFNLRVCAESPCINLNFILSKLRDLGYQKINSDVRQIFRPQIPRWAQWDGNFVELEFTDGAIRITGPLFVIRKIGRTSK